MSHLEGKVVVTHSDSKTASDNNEEFKQRLMFFKAFSGALTKDTLTPGYPIILKCLKMIEEAVI